LNCVICKNGETRPGHVTVTLQHGDSTVIVKQVPADVCQNCGEHYLSEEISAELERRVEAAAKNGDEVTVLLYAA
jgi:YgiT-type zinc finger domain-containing protein